MSDMTHPVIRSGILLALIALLGTALLAGVNDFTRERIIAQKKNRELQQLNEIVHRGSFNNDLLADLIEIEDEVFFQHRSPVLVYRARMDARPVAVIMTVTAPDGYNGDIKLLIGISANAEIIGVRVVSHKETPGLGDPIEIEKSDWISGFTNRSLLNTANREWAVKRDGGRFDQFTGATITPRAVVKAVQRALIYFETNGSMLFDTATQAVSRNGQ